MRGVILPDKSKVKNDIWQRFCHSLLSTHLLQYSTSDAGWDCLQDCENMTEKSVAGRNNELVNDDQSSGPTSRDNGLVSQAHLPCTCQLILLDLMIENESSLLIQYPTPVTSMHQRVERESNLANCILSGVIRPAYTNFLQSPVFTGCISLISWKLSLFSWEQDQDTQLPIIIQPQIYLIDLKRFYANKLMSQPVSCNSLQILFRGLKICFII